MDAKTKDLWVFIETREDGSPCNVGLELLNPGRMLADKQGGKLVGAVVGCQTEKAVKAAEEYGADQVIVVEGEAYREYSTDAYTAALYYLMEKYAPTTMLIGATSVGRDLAPRLSCRLNTGLTADCTSLDVDGETGNMAWTRPAFGGNLMATILCPDHRPQLGTVRPGVYKKQKPSGIGKPAKVIREDFAFPIKNIRTRVLERMREAAGELVNLENAEIIVSGGRGVGGPDGFQTLKNLADVLGATVGASRAAVDADWIGHSHQVGQTGKTVSPRIYIA